MNLIESRDPIKTFSTLLDLIRHSEQDFKVTGVKNNYGLSRIEIVFSNGVRYEVAYGPYSENIRVFGPEPRTAYGLDVVVGDITLASRIFSTSEQRQQFIDAAPEEHRSLFKSYETQLD